MGRRKQQGYLAKPNQRMGYLLGSVIPIYGPNTNKGLQSRSEIDRTSKQIHRVHALHAEIYFAMVVGRVDHRLCDDHGVLQGWLEREDESPRKANSRLIKVRPGQPISKHT